MKKAGRIFIIAIITIFTLSIIYGTVLTYRKFFPKPIVFTNPAKTIETPKQVKKVKKIKKSVNIQLYDKKEFDKKYKLDLKAQEEVGAIGVVKTETGKRYTTSIIDTETGENKLMASEVRSKFRIIFDPALYAEVKIIGSPDADIARMGIKLGLIRINGNIDIYTKGEVSSRRDYQYQTGYGVYGGVEWHPLK